MAIAHRVEQDGCRQDEWTFQDLFGQREDSFIFDGVRSLKRISTRWGKNFGGRIVAEVCELDTVSRLSTEFPKE